jgi:acetolactate synthase-1/2/3 large subunit
MRFEAIARALERHGVRRAFGVPGTQTAALVEALRGSGVSFTLSAHELGASFMAGGYFRAGGGPAAVLTIGGPGFTNALTGIAEARQDSAALVHVVNAPPSAPGERYRLQEIDQAGIARTLVKGTFRIGPESDPDVVLAEAVRLAVGGEPGPVLVEIGGATAGGERPSVEAVGGGDGAGPDRTAALAELADRWRRARLPLLLAGQGASGAAGDVRRLVEATRCPVLTTPSARGLLPEDHPLAMGFDVLRGGVETANELLERSDLVLVLGAKLGHNGSAGFRLRLPAGRLVRVDTDAEALAANYPASIAIEATAETVLARLLGAERPAGGSDWPAAELAEARTRFRTPDGSVPDPVVRGPSGIRRASEFFAWLREALPASAILATDSGLHQVLVRRHYDVLSARGLLAPSDFQSMGFGIPAAIGARLAAPDRPVATIVGDGGFLMSGLELTTAVRDGIGMLVVVFNDGHLNQIRLQQLREEGRSFGVDVGRLDHARFAEAIGAEHVALEETGAAEDLVRRLERERPVILEVRVDDSLSMRSRSAGARVKSVLRGVRDATGRGRQ